MLGNFENAVTAATAAVKEGSKTQSDQKYAQEVFADTIEQAKSGNMPPEEIDKRIKTLESVYKRQRDHAKSLLGQSQRLQREAKQKGEEARGSWWSTGWIDAAGLERKANLLGREGQMEAQAATMTARMIERLKRGRTEAAISQQKADEQAAIRARNPFEDTTLPTRDSFNVGGVAGGWKDTFKNLGKNVVEGAKDIFSRATFEPRLLRMRDKLKQAGVGALGAVASGLKYEQDIRKEAEKEEKEKAKRNLNQMSLIGVSDMARQMQLSIGAAKSPELRTMEDVKDNTKTAADHLSDMAGGIESIATIFGEIKESIMQARAV